MNSTVESIIRGFVPAYAAIGNPDLGGAVDSLFTELLQLLQLLFSAA